MSTVAPKPGKRTRRLIIAVLVVGAYIGLMAFVFNIGKGYYVYLDNSDFEDGSVMALNGVVVSIDGGETSEYYPRDRDKLRLRGRKHTLNIEVLEDGSTYEKTVDVGGQGDNVLLSIPKLVAGIEPAVSVFEPYVYVEPTEEFIPGTTDGSVNPEAQPSIVP